MMFEMPECLLEDHGKVSVGCGGIDSDDAASTFQIRPGQSIFVHLLATIGHKLIVVGLAKLSPVFAIVGCKDPALVPSLSPIHVPVPVIDFDAREDEWRRQLK